MPTPEKNVEETQQVIVFELDAEEYAVPIGVVREVVKIPALTPVPNSSPFVLGVMNLRGQIVPIIDLEKRFHLTRTQATAPEHIVVAEDTGNALVGVQVDKVTEVLKVPVSAIKPTPAMVTSKIAAEYVKGVVVIAKAGAVKPAEESGTEDMRILLLLDLHKLVSAEDLVAAAAAAVDTPESSEKPL